jgi:hypothetical protein
VRFAKDFVITIGFGYLSMDLGIGRGGYHLERHAQQTTAELRRLLEKANIARDHYHRLDTG